MSYQTEYNRSMQDPQDFWRDQAKALEWFKFPQQILQQDADGIGHWFADGEMNTAYMALDHHVQNGRGDQTALIYDSPVTDTKKKISYAELTDEVARTAGMLADLGVVKGDRVIIYMPMIPEAVISMLAVARLGAIHSVVFGGFAPPELALRIDDATPKVILSASCGIEVKRVIEYKPLLDKAIELAKHKPQSCVIFQRPQCNAPLTAGERLDPPTQEWLTEKSGKTVVDHWWQTETGWGITANLWGVEPKPVKFGSSTLPTPGFDVRILDENGKQLARNEQGYIAIKLPLPPACMNRIWGDDNKFSESYLQFLPGYYTTGDGGYIDDEGYVFVMGRVDDVINVAGHRLSTGEIEEVVAAHPAVAECAVIARDDELKGQVPMGLVVLKSGVIIDEAVLQKELVNRVRDAIGAITCYKDTVILKRLPKTRSGKTLRKTMNRIVNGQEYVVPSTIDDPGIIPEIIETLKKKGFVA